MASLSDQIDRFSRITRTIKSTTASISHRSLPFTTAILVTPLGDLIRDIHPAELGLFSLIHDDAPQLKRAEFPTATPLRKHYSRPDAKQDIEPEVYANAALKYIDQYQPIRPMPRAYDRIVAVLEKLAVVRSNIDALNTTLKESSKVGQEPPPKIRVDEEARRVHELQTRLQDLARKKEDIVKRQRKPSARGAPATSRLPVSPASPQANNLWSTPIGPSRTLQFTDNLLDEHVDLNDVSTSFHSPEAQQAQNLLPDESMLEMPTISSPTWVLPDEDSGIDEAHQSGHLSPAVPDTPATSSRPTSAVSDFRTGSTQAETPRTRQRKVKINVELDRIVAKIWATVGEVLLPHSSTKSLPVNDTISHIQHMASQIPQPESPIASSVSTISVDTQSPPSFQQVMTAHLLAQLLNPPYSLPLNKLRESMMIKAKTCGVMTAQGRTTRVLYDCVAKRLVKIDRGSGEQTVKFDV